VKAKAGGLLMTAVVVSLLSIAGAASAGEEAETPPIQPAVEATEQLSITLEKTHSGATIADDFSGDRLDRSVWTTWLNDPGLRVLVGGGEVRITGTTRAEMPTQYNHVALASKVFWPPDQVLVTRMRAASGIDREKGNQIFQIHLCGCMPDYNSSVAFAKLGDRIGWLRMWRMWDRGETDAQSFPPFGDESESFHQVKVEYNRGKTRGFVEGPDGWIELGQAKANFHGHTRAELKVIMSPRNFSVDMRLDDCRLYLHPEVYPAVFVVNNDYRHRAPRFLDARNEELTLKVFDKSSGNLVGQSSFEPDRGVFEVTLDRNATFPISAEVKVYRKGELFAGATIKSSRLSGLYPGDVYEIIEGESGRQPSGRAPRRAR